MVNLRRYDSAMDFARGHMPADIQADIEDMLLHRDEYWVPNKIVELRERLSGRVVITPGCQIGFVSSTSSTACV